MCREAPPGRAAARAGLRAPSGVSARPERSEGLRRNPVTGALRGGVSKHPARPTACSPLSQVADQVLRPSETDRRETACAESEAHLPLTPQLGAPTFSLQQSRGASPTKVSRPAKIVLQPALLRADDSRHRCLWPAESFAAPVSGARRDGLYHRLRRERLAAGANGSHFPQIALFRCGRCLARRTVAPHPLGPQTDRAGLSSQRVPAA